MCSSPHPASSSPSVSRLSRESPVSDSWSDPINSVEMGRSPSPPPRLRRRQSSEQDEVRNIMELSEEEDNEELGDEHSTTEAEAYDYDHDNIEDVMNVPGKVAPPQRPLDLRRVSLGGRKPTPEDIHQLEIRRAELEHELQEERAKHERMMAGVSDDNGLIVDGVDHDGAVPAEELDSILDSGKDGWVSVILRHRMGSVLNACEQLTEGQAAVSSDDAITEPCTSPPTNLPVPPFNTPTSSNVVTTPGGKHIQFALQSTVHDTPFTKTLNYFKQFKGKENSPSKSRRNASLPEEIAELAKEAQEEEEGSEDLEMYREMDLAPMDPVVETSSAGDLIMLGTPTKPVVNAHESEVRSSLDRMLAAKSPADEEEENGEGKEDAAGHRYISNISREHFEGNKSPPTIACGLGSPEDFKNMIPQVSQLPLPRKASH